MDHYATPTDREILDYFLRNYLGQRGSFLAACILRAYLDVCRTIRGIAKHEGGARAFELASTSILSAIENVGSALDSQQSYDAWHRATCDSLRATYESAGYTRFSVGHAQKWLNMAVKYASLIGDRASPHSAALFNLGHVPIDSVILQELSKRGLPHSARYIPWSGISSYETYMALQEWVRAAFPTSSPLAVEFHLWEPIGDQ